MKLLVPVDGSDYALKAVKMAIRLIREGGGEIILLSVAQDISQLGAWEIGHSPRILKEIEVKAERAIGEAEKLLKEEAIEIKKSLLETGVPADEIIRVAKEEAIDMIVMGSRGLTGLSKYLLGSVTHKVVAHAPCSVLVVK
jgi:nucleotide-binding universal stress UspA family protein